MAKKTLNIKGTSDKNYDLDEIQEQRRDNPDLDLVVQIHEYTDGENPNPENIKLGQIWLSKKK